MESPRGPQIGALGYSPATIERHVRDSATGYTRYIASRPELLTKA